MPRGENQEMINLIPMHNDSFYVSEIIGSYTKSCDANISAIIIKINFNKLK